MIRQKSIVAVLLLTLFTCGIYGLYWIYDTTTQVKSVLGKSNSAGMDLLLCIICFPYAYYWYFRTSKELAEAEKTVGLPGTDNAVINLVLLVFGLGIVSILIMQGQLNGIAEKKANA